MPTPASDAARAQDNAAERLLPAAQAAVAAARAVAPSAPPAPPVPLVESVEMAVNAAMLFVLASSLRSAPSGSAAPAPTRADVREMAAEAAPRVAESLWSSATQHVASTPLEATPLAQQADTAFARSLARTEATRVAALSSLAMGQALGFKYKIWMSRGDSRVRTLHRELHGKPVEMGEPFKRWPDGHILNYPGDPAAPMDAWINCRCFMWASPTKRLVREALSPANLVEAFNLAASLEADFDA